MTARTTEVAPYPTAQRILDVAERLAQTRGFNGFSYADIAAEVGITKASLHYHFPTKADLGSALVVRYSQAFQAALGTIETAGGSALQKLDRYVQLYEQVLSGDRMCLCGMLAAEFETLPAKIQQELRTFFDMNEDWLGNVLDEGLRAGTLHFSGPSQEVGRMLTSALEGSMLLARSYGDPSRFAVVARRVIGELAWPGTHGQWTGSSAIADHSIIEPS